MKKVIQVKNLTKQFNNFTAVDNISFSVSKGDIFAFLGPNGAGKSTSIKMLTTLSKPTSGTIKINGHNPVTSPNKVRSSFGIIFQEASLDKELTAQENLFFHGIVYGLGKKEIRDRIDYLLNFVELKQEKHKVVKKFSGGMKRRLEIARGLMHKPKILFLDEPTLGLDPQSREHIWKYIKKLNQEEGVTIFFTTHYMQEAEFMAKNISIISRGKIIKQSDFSSLKQETNTNTLEEAFIKLTN